jgi:hypothetical protein
MQPSHAVTQYTFTALIAVTTSSRSCTIPSIISVTNLPPWEQPFLRHNHRLPTGPSWPPTSLSDITEDGDATLYAWYIPYRLQANHFSLAQASSRRVLHLPQHEREALPSPCTPPFVVYDYLSIRVSGQPSRPSQQSRSKTSIHSSTPSNSTVPL